MDRGVGLSGLHLAAFLAFVVLAAFFHLSCVDIGFHVRTGELVWQTRSIPATNTFSSVHAEAPWLLHQWLPGLAFYGAWQWGGVGGAIALRILLVVACYMAVACHPHVRSARPVWLVLLLLTVSVAFARSRFLARPFLFSALLLAVLQLVHSRWALSRRWCLCGLPCLMALWANVHVGVVYGFIWLAACGLGEVLEVGGWTREARTRAWAWIACAGVSTVAAVATVTWISPHGPAYLLLPFKYFLDPFWKPLILEFHAPAVWVQGSIGAVVLATVLCPPRRDGRRSWSTLLPFVAFAVLACRTQRAALMFAVAAVPALCRQWGGGGLRFPAKPVLYVIPLGLWALLSISYLQDPTLRYGGGVYDGYHPRALFAKMAVAVPPQLLFNDMRYGGGMLLWLYPQWRPYIDGRCEAYPRRAWEDAVAIVAGGPSAVDRLDKRGVTAALVHLGRGRGPLAVALHQHPGWVLVAVQAEAALFLKAVPLNEAAIAALAYRLLWPGDVELTWLTVASADRALEECRRALAMDADWGYAQTVRARALLLVGRYAEAREAYAALVEGGRGGANHWRDLAYVLQMDGDLDAMRTHCERMIKGGVAPGYAHYLLAMDARRRGRPVEAERHARLGMGLPDWPQGAPPSSVRR